VCANGSRLGRYSVNTSPVWAKRRGINTGVIIKRKKKPIIATRISGDGRKRERRLAKQASSVDSVSYGKSPIVVVIRNYRRRNVLPENGRRRSRNDTVRFVANYTSRRTLFSLRPEIRRGTATPGIPYGRLIRIIILLEYNS